MLLPSTAHRLLPAMRAHWLDSLPLAEAVRRVIQETIADFTVGALEGLCLFFWTLAKFAAMLTNALLEQSLWAGVRDAVLAALQNVAQPMLRQVLAGGLVYALLMLCGLALMLPLAAETKFVKPERVILWAIVLATLFVSSSLGFDMLESLESMRLWLASATLGGDDLRPGLNQIVAAPLQANSDELLNLEFKLPGVFGDTYFQKISTDPASPEYNRPVKETTTETVEVLGPFTHELQLETAQSIGHRLSRAFDGFLRALMVLAGALVVLQFGVAFAVLSITALVLMAFLVAALPIGFFEFGGVVLSNIVKQYLYLIALTVLAGFLARIIGSYAANEIGGGDPFARVAFYFAVLLVAGIAMGGVIRMAFGALTGSFTMMQTIGGSVSALAAREGPDVAAMAGQKMAQLGSAALTVSAAVATGGASLAVTGAGSVLGLASSPQQPPTAIAYSSQSPDSMVAVKGQPPTSSSVVATTQHGDSPRRQPRAPSATLRAGLTGASFPGGSPDIEDEPPRRPAWRSGPATSASSSAVATTRPQPQQPVWQPAPRPRTASANGGLATEGSAQMRNGEGSSRRRRSSRRGQPSPEEAQPQSTLPTQPPATAQPISTSQPIQPGAVSAAASAMTPTEAQGGIVNNAAQSVQPDGAERVAGEGLFAEGPAPSTSSGQALSVAEGASPIATPGQPLAPGGKPPSPESLSNASDTLARETVTPPLAKPTPAPGPAYIPPAPQSNAGGNGKRGRGRPRKAVAPSQPALHSASAPTATVNPDDKAESRSQSELAERMGEAAEQIVAAVERAGEILERSENKDEK